MINKINSRLKIFVSPSIRFEIKQKKGRIVHFLAGLCFWKWKSFKFPLSETNLTIVHYLGRPKNKPALMALLGINPNTSSAFVNTNATSEKAFVSEFPMLNALCLPFCLNTIVKLGRSTDDITATYSRSLRRSINGQRAEYGYKAVNDSVKIDSIERRMLWTYANTQHDVSAAHLHPEVVKSMAQSNWGRLDLLYQGEEEVGCHLGNSYICKSERYWHVNRLGYPDAVLSDYKRWGEVNSINLHLALESAIENGYDYCDYGVSLARPGAGLIEWKRRRKGFLATNGNFNYFYLKLPVTGAAQFLWDAPLFAVERGKVTLHLGIPEGKTDEEIAARYHEMGYGGLYKVYLQCIKQPSEHLIETIRGLYVDQESQPMVITRLENSLALNTLQKDSDENMLIKSST